MGAEIPGAVNAIAFGMIGIVAVTLRCTPCENYADRNTEPEKAPAA